MYLSMPYFPCSESCHLHLMSNNLSAKRPECLIDPDCPEHLACIQEKCQDPCTSQTCGVNAECRVNNHRAVCTCRPNYTGDPFKVCYEREKYSIDCMRNVQHVHCVSAGCKSDNECSYSEACINRECQDPCPYERCGTNAICSTQVHQPKCSCLPGYDGDPYVQCKQPECRTDPDCPYTLACRNEKCVDPCDCAANADCDARNHRGYCTCRTGFTGDPYTAGCYPSKKNTSFESLHTEFTIFGPSVPQPIEEDNSCKKDADCPSKQACFNGDCENPCLRIQPCADHAICTVYDDLPLRTMVCVCEPGYTGKGDLRCDRIGILQIIFELEELLLF